MLRRLFLKVALTAAGCSAFALPKLKITRIRYYQPKRPNPTFNQSNRIVTIETDGGITGIGEGGSTDMIEQCAAMLIGEDASRTDHLWQLMFRGWFYPPGREKLHALGALDIALWDIKAKALGVPLYELLGGLAREHIECYSTGRPLGSIKETVQAVMEAGFRCYRTAFDGPNGPRSSTFNTHDQIIKRWMTCPLTPSMILASSVGSCACAFMNKTAASEMCG